MQVSLTLSLQVKRKPPIDKTEWNSFFDENGQLAKSRDFICINILERVWSLRASLLPMWIALELGVRKVGDRACLDDLAPPDLSPLPPLCQGLHPFVRTEAWKFLTGYYSWQSSQDERLTVDSTRR